MMKKILLSTICCMIMFIGTVMVCSAQIAPERVALGGIQVGATMGYVKSIYGEPSWSESSFDRMFGQTLTTHHYGETLSIVYTENGRVNDIRSTGNNGFATPDGVRVGMNVGALQKVYGQSDDVVNSSNTRFYAMQGAPYVGIRFDFKGGKITQIWVADFGW